jgi:hypothetical protein
MSSRLSKRLPSSQQTSNRIRKMSSVIVALRTPLSPKERICCGTVVWATGN